MVAGRAIAAAVAAVCVGTAHATVSCKYHATDPTVPGSNEVVGLTWDLSKLAASKDYIVQDSSLVDVSNFTFQFNVCQDTVSKPTGSGTCSGAYAPAWQTDGQACYALGASVRHATGLRPITFSVHDPEYPALGVDLRYFSGEDQFCPEGPSGIRSRRSFKISVFCDAVNHFPAPGKKALLQAPDHVIEREQCQYELAVASPYGCPQECPIHEGKLCSNHGICRYDTDAKTAKCFCDEGYGQADCSEDQTGPNGGAVAGSVIGGLIVGIGGVALWHYYQRRQGASGAGRDAGFYSGLN